jgi:hypothetical protein
MALYNPRPKEGPQVKISALAGVLICFLAAPESTKCQQELTGLQRIHIVIENLDKETADMGLNEKSLRDQILVALKRDIPKITIVDTLGASSFVYLQITSLLTATKGAAACVVVSLERPVQIIRDDGSKYLSIAEVWKEGHIELGPVDHMPSRIRDRINEAMTAFAAEYYKQNP